MEPQYKYRELLAAIGSDKDIAKVLAEYGYLAPPLPSIRGWRVRNSIPSKWLPILMDWASKNGLLSSPGNLVREPF